MALESLQDLFLNEIKDIYNAEKQIVRALPRMAKTAESPELEQAFTKHYFLKLVAEAAGAVKP